MVVHLSAQEVSRDSLYRAFARAKTDSAKLQSSFDIMETLNDFEISEQKKWVDTTAEIAAKMRGNGMAQERQLFLANWYRQNGDYDQSYQLAMQAATKLRLQKDSVRLSAALFEAGSSLAEFNPKAAIRVLQEGADLSNRIGDENLAARCLTNLTYAMNRAGLSETETYRDSLLSALTFFKKTEDMMGILVTNFSLVDYFTSKGQLERARQSVHEMEAALLANKDEIYTVYPLVSEGNILMKEGKVARALSNYEKSWNILSHFEIVDGQLELFPRLIDAYVAAGNFEKAYFFSSKYQNLKDSLLSLEKTKTVENLQTRYETEKKEARIAAQQADLQRSQQEKWALGIGVALLGLLTILIWRQRRKTQTINLELATSNEEIQQKNQKLDLLMRELHHRVKNNLQLVSSLLRLQSRQVGDEAASAAIKAGQLRVEAMSLIHQRLYREEGITLVNMQEFTQDLVEKIAFAFGFSSDKFSYKIEMEPRELDVDKAMPLSLILNELVTNSFKYAFGETSEPLLKISIQQQGDKLRLHFSDNGIGLPSEHPHGSFGSKLIQSLSAQLQGQAHQWNEKGANFELVFPA